MGMFDYVNAPDVDCPSCGKPITSWQSKDGDCFMETLEVSDVRNYYALCEKCKEWVEFNRKVLPDFEMTHRGKGE